MAKISGKRLAELEENALTDLADCREQIRFIDEQIELAKEQRLRVEERIRRIERELDDGTIVRAVPSCTE